MGEKPDMRTKLDFLYQEMLGEVGDILQKLESAKTSINETTDSAASRLREEAESAERKLNMLSGQILASHERNNAICEALETAFRRSLENQTEQFAALAETLTAAAAEKNVSAAIEKALNRIEFVAKNTADTNQQALTKMLRMVSDAQEKSADSIKTAMAGMETASNAIEKAGQANSKKLVISGLFVSAVSVLAIAGAIVFSDAIRGGPVATPKILKNAEFGDVASKSFVYMDQQTRAKVTEAIRRVKSETGR